MLVTPTLCRDDQNRRETLLKVHTAQLRIIALELSYLTPSAVHLTFWSFYPRLTAGNNNPPCHMSQVWRLNETVRKIRGYDLTQPHRPRTKPLCTLNWPTSAPHAVTLLPFFWTALFLCLRQARPYPFLKAQVKNSFFPHEAFLHHLAFL